jgi:hypothetical protein
MLEEDDATCGFEPNRFVTHCLSTEAASERIRVSLQSYKGYFLLSTLHHVVGV